MSQSSSSATPFTVLTRGGSSHGTPDSAVTRALAEAGCMLRSTPGPDVDIVLDAARPERADIADLPSCPGGLVLLLTDAGAGGGGFGGHHDRQSLVAQVRKLALAAAPRLRVNAVGGDPAAVVAALRLILDAPSMTGQVLWLERTPRQRAVDTANLVRLAGNGEAEPGRLSEPKPSWSGLRRTFVRDLVLPCRIGVHRHEQLGAQRVRVAVVLGSRETEGPVPDRLSAVVDYDRIVAGIRRVAQAEHVSLVETLAERIAAVCLADPRVLVAEVTAEKLDVYADAQGAGVTIERWNRNSQRNPIDGPGS